MVGLSRLELLTSRLSGVRSNQLSYRPILGANARSLRITVSCHQILRSTYLSVRLPWICRHSLLSIKAFASLSVSRKGEIFVYSCVIQTNPAVNVPISTSPLNLFSFLALRKTFALLSTTYIGLHPIRKRWWRRGESNSWPPACKAGALPAELRPHFMRDAPSKLDNAKL